MMQKLRNDIDAIDNKLSLLLKERFELSKKIGEYKQVNCLDIYDESRENEKISKIKSLTDDEDFGSHIVSVFEKIIEESKDYQKERQFDFGLLGEKLSYSYSPEIHKLLGGYEFGIFERAPEQFEDFIKNGTYKGLCITMPYKKKIMEYCDEISETARNCDSVNVILRREDGTLYGDNSDYYGLRYQLVSSKIDVRGGKCLILGSGGVSGTCRQVLTDCQADEIITVSRSGNDNYDNLSRHYDAEYIINATPVGMNPNNGESLIDIDNFTNLKGVVDLVYNPLRTRLVLDAQKKGINASGGLHMLVAQAALACEIFTGKHISADDIEAVCDSIENKIENIVLIGMPGCGKTSIGQTLAKITGKPFADTDKLIEDADDRLCEQIIITDGIDAFREMEEKTVRKVCEKGGFVVALGGGAVEIPSLEQVIKENGKAVYIRRDLDELSIEGRPISIEKGVEEIFEERQDKYISWADITADNEGIEETSLVIAALLKYLKRGTKK